MKKAVFLLALLAGGGWWYFIGGRTITEEHVNTFYRDLEVAILSRDAKQICPLMADDFETTGTVEAYGRTLTTTQDKAQVCEAWTKVYEQIEKIGDKMGGILQLDSDYKIHSIEISADKKTAIVDFSSSLDVGGTILNMRSRNTETLIRRNGKMLLLRSEGNGSVRSGG